jgi:release factor glutamine methyltransferase
VALFAGPDGLEIVRELIPAAKERSPWLALEIGAGQADAVEELMRGAGFADVDRHRDLAGIERVVVGCG